MLGIIVNEMQRSVGLGSSGQHMVNAARASRDALFHYQMRHLEPGRPQMRVANPEYGWWSTQRVVPLMLDHGPYNVVGKRIGHAPFTMYDSRAALFNYQMTHRERRGPQMHVVDPQTGYWTTRVPQLHRALGDAPDDFEAAVDLQYTPVRQGWFYGQPVGGYPGGVNYGRGAPEVFVGASAIANLGGNAAAAIAHAGGDEASLRKLVRSQHIQTTLQAVSTFSLAAVAGLAIAKSISEMKATKSATALRGQRSRRR
jgi:hypothetical protein